MESSEIRAWANITHQRFLLRQAVLARPIDIASAVQALRRLTRSADAVGASRLRVTAALVCRRMTVLDGAGNLNATISFPLVEAVDAAYGEAIGVAFRGHVHSAGNMKDISGA